MTNTPTNSFEWVIYIAQEYAELFIRGTWITLIVSVLGTLIGFVLGYAVGMIEDSQISPEDHIIKRGIVGFFKLLAKIYVELFRGTPMIVQAMIVFYGLRQSGLEIGSISAGILVTVLNTGAYMSETVRAGIKSIDAGQREGALALGMSPIAAMFHIILPQACSTAFPPLSNSLIGLVKDTSLAYSVALVEILASAQRIAARTYDYFWLYLEAAFVYLMICSILTVLQHRGEKALEARR